MQPILEFLNGKKSYLVAIGIILTAFVALGDGSIDVGTFAQRALEALGLAALRKGVAKTTAK